MPELQQPTSSARDFESFAGVRSSKLQLPPTESQYRPESEELGSGNAMRTSMLPSSPSVRRQAQEPPVEDLGVLKISTLRRMPQPSTPEANGVSLVRTSTLKRGLTPSV